MTGPIKGVADVRAMTQEAFTAWLRDWPDSLAAHIKLYGKPRVRVPGVTEKRPEPQP